MPYAHYGDTVYIIISTEEIFTQIWMTNALNKFE